MLLIRPVIMLLLVLLMACTSVTSEEYLESARKNFEKNEYSTAVINLKNALQKDSENIQARYLLGKTYIKLGDGASAEKELNAARNLGLMPDQIATFLGNAYLLQNKLTELLKNISVEDGFSNQLRAEVLVLRARAHMMLGEAESAEKLLDNVFQDEPDFLQALLVKIQLTISQGDLIAAQKGVDQVLNREPGNLEAWLMAGEISRLKGDFTTAINNYDQALKLKPNNLFALLGNAGANVAANNFKSAVQHIQNILKLSPKNPLANYLQAVVLYKQKNSEGAEQFLLKVLKVAPEHVPSHQMLGTIYFSDGRFEQARVSLEKVVRKLPGNLAAIKLLSATWLKLSEPAEAIQVLEKALPAYEADSQMLALLGSAYMQANDSARGTEYLERAVDQSPGNAAIQTQLALGRLATGKTSEAVEILEAVVQLGQDVFQADILLVLAHMRSKEYKKALDKARLLAKKMPNNATPYNLEGAAYARIGDKPAARQSFEKALSIQSDFVPAVINLAGLDVENGDLQSAKARFDQILKKKKGNVQILLALAKIASRENDQAGIEKWLTQAWENNVGNLQVGELLIRRWIERRDFAKAMDIAKEMTAQHPDDFAALRSLGVVQTASGLPGEAIKTFSGLVKHYPDVAMSHYLLGKAYAANENTLYAKRHFEKSLSIDAEFFPVQLILAQLAVKNGEPDKALKIAKKIQKQKPALSIGYQLEGDLHSYAKKPKAAAKAYAKGFAKMPSRALAVKYYRAEKEYKPEKAAISLLKQWLEQTPNDIPVRMILAQSYTTSDKNQQAVDQYKKILVLNSKDVAALNNLAWLYYEMGEKSALDYGKKAYDLAPANPLVVDTYGWLLIQDGKLKEGLSYLQDAFQKAPDVAEIQFHYAVALEKNGEKQKAKVELEKLLAKHSDFPGAAKAKAMLSKMQ